MKPTKKQRKAIVRYVRWVANEMELRDWTIDIVYDPPSSEDSMAEIKCVYGRKRAQIRLCRDFTDLPLDRQRHTIVHECVHMHMSGIDWAFNNVQAHLAPAMFQVAENGITDAIEFGVDALAEALAKHLPLPEYGKAKA